MCQLHTVDVLPPCHCRWRVDKQALELLQVAVDDLPASPQQPGAASARPASEMAPPTRTHQSTGFSALACTRMSTSDGRMEGMGTERISVTLDASPVAVYTACESTVTVTQQPHDVCQLRRRTAIMVSPSLNSAGAIRCAGAPASTNT